MTTTEKQQVIEEYQKEQEEKEKERKEEERKKRQNFLEELDLMMGKTSVYLFIIPIFTLVIFVFIVSFFNSKVMPINSDDLQYCSIMREDIIEDDKLEKIYFNGKYEREGDTILFTIENKGVVRSKEGLSEIVEQYSRIDDAMEYTVLAGLIGLSISILQYAFVAIRKKDYMEEEE